MRWSPKRELFVVVPLALWAFAACSGQAQIDDATLSGATGGTGGASVGGTTSFAGKVSAGSTGIAGSAIGGTSSVGGSGVGGSGLAGTGSGKGCGFGPPCPAPYRCVSGTCTLNQACRPLEQVCDPGGQLLLRCLADGSGYQAIQNCQASGLRCSNGACRDLFCSPGSVFCNGNDLRGCSGDGRGLRRR